MKYSILGAAIAVIMTTSMDAKADVCGTINSHISDECSTYGWFDSSYWQCKSLQMLAGGLCQALKYKYSAVRVAALQSACSKSDPQACKAEFEKEVPAVLQSLQTEETKEASDFKAQIIEEMEKDIPSGPTK